MILETDRLTLRYIRPSDIPILKEIIFSNDKVMAYLPFGRAVSDDEAESLLAYYPESEQKTGLFIAEDKASQTVVGFAGSIPFSAMGQDDIEFGFGFGEMFWNRGYGYEIASAFIDYVLDDLKLPRLMALVNPNNKPSIHVLEKLGYQYIDTIHLPNRGERRVYSIKRD